MTDKNLSVQSEQNPMMALINRAATDPAFDVAKLEHLLQVKAQWERDQARKSYMGAMSEFKANPPQITKNRKVAFKDVKYSHASLDQVSTLIGAALSKHGISHTWQVKQTGANIEVTCILTHSQGHSESVSMTSLSDQSGSKNSIQALGSAVTYLQRYTLLAATGMAVKDDDDGKAAGPTKPAIAAPQETPKSVQGKSACKIKGVFKTTGGFRIVGDVDYFTKHETVAKAASRLSKTSEDTILVWDCDSQGTRWVSDIDRATVVF